MSNEIEAVIFDVGEVLHTYDPKPIHEDIVETLGINSEALKEHWNPLSTQLHAGAITENEFWEEFKKKTGSKVVLPEVSLLVRRYDVGFSINSKVMEIVHELKEREYKLAALSNTIEPHYKFNEEAGLYQAFDVKIFSYLAGVRKPDPKAYELAIQALDIEPNHGVFIDDREVNVEGALAVGLKGIKFTSAEKLRQELKNLGVRI